MASEERLNGDSADVDANDQRQIVVQDPEDFAKARQLRSVFDARDDYQRQKQQAKSNLEIKKPHLREIVWNAMQRFAFALEPLADRHNAADRFWTEKTYKVDGFAFAGDLASKQQGLEHLKQHRPEGYEKYRQAKRKKRQKDVLMHSTGEPDLKRLVALQRWAATEKPAEFEGIRDMIGRTPNLCYQNNKGKNGFVKSPPPVRFSDEVFRDLNRFIDSIGLGFDVEETNQTKIDDGLLEEVDEWRQNNL